MRERAFYPLIIHDCAVLTSKTIFVSCDYEKNV